MNAFRRWYREHFQKTLGTILGMLACVDLAGYADAITTIFGARGYALIRLTVAAAIVWKSFQARQARTLPAPDPNASRP